MAPFPDPRAWCEQLPWLADLEFDARGGTAAAGISPLLATAVSRLPPRAALARELGRGEALGVAMVNAVVNQLLAQHALPQFATLAVAGNECGGFVESVAAGVVRACRGHGLPIAVPIAARAAIDQVGFSLAGSVLGAMVPLPAVGDTVIAMRSTGPTEGDFAQLARLAQERRLAWSDPMPSGDTLGQLVLAPGASHASVMHEGLRNGWPFYGITIDGPLVASVRASLPPGLDVAWDFASWRPAAPFADWPECSPAASSFGCNLLVIVPERDAQRWFAHFAAWNEPGTVVGRVIAG